MSSDVSSKIFSLIFAIMAKNSPWLLLKILTLGATGIFLVSLKWLKKTDLFLGRRCHMTEIVYFEIL